MFRFTIRDVLWLTVAVGLGCGWFVAAHRSELLEARLHSRDREAEQLKARTEAVASENATNFATFEALVTAFRQAELSEDQRASIRSLFSEQLQRHGVEIQHRE